MTKHRTLAGFLGLLAAIFCLTSLVAAQIQSTSPAARTFSQVAISPDGNQIAWVEPIVDAACEVKARRFTFKI